MTANAATTVLAPVKKSITVKASVEHAFKVFTDGFDSWWPRSPPHRQAADGEGRHRNPGGRPLFRPRSRRHRVRLGTCPDVGAAEPFRAGVADRREVAVRTGSGEGERSGGAVYARSRRPDARRSRTSPLRAARRGRWRAVRTGVDSPNGWGGLLQAYAARAAEYHPAVAPLALIFTMNDSLASRSFDKIAEEDIWRRPTDRSNPMQWILGHMVATRAQMLKTFGEPFDTGWGDLFGRGASLGSAAGYPTASRCRPSHAR